MQQKPVSVARLAITLFLICATTALLLSVANEFTKDARANVKTAAVEKSLKLVIPAAASFEKIDIDGADPSAKNGVRAAYRAKGSDGKGVGVVINVAEQGYNGTIDMMVGFDASKNVTGVNIVSFSETPGLGTKAADEKFIDQYIGSSAPLSVVKSGAKQGEVTAVSGATITSKAVTRGVNAARSAGASVAQLTVNN